MKNNEETIKRVILNKARAMGEHAVVDPVPDAYDDNSRSARIETMTVYFSTLRKECLAECERQGGIACSTLAGPILNSLQMGFEALMDNQPGYKEDGLRRIRVEKADALAFEKEAFDLMKKGLGL